MHFEDFSSFIDMAGYGLYVWMSFGVAMLSLLGLWFDSLLTKRNLFKRVLTEQARQVRMNAAAVQTKRTDGEIA